MERASHSIWGPPIGHILHFLLKSTLKLYTKYLIFAKLPLSTGNGKWDDVLQGETSIAAEVINIIPWMCKEDTRTF